MKKLISGSILVLLALGIILFIIKKYFIGSAISIIGRSNGPTSIFIAGKINDFTPVYFIIGVLIIIVLFFLRNK